MLLVERFEQRHAEAFVLRERDVDARGAVIGGEIVIRNRPGKDKPPLRHAVAFEQRADRHVIGRGRIRLANEHEPVLLVDIALVMFRQLDVIFDLLVGDDAADEQEIGPALFVEHFFEGRPAVPGGHKDIAWFRSDGSEMDDASWFDSTLTALGMFLAGDGIRARDEHGRRITDDSFLLWLNAGDGAVDVTLPDVTWSPGYTTVLDTSSPSGQETPPQRHAAGDTLCLAAGSCLLLQAG